jgi:hypothetical protein
MNGSRRLAQSIPDAGTAPESLCNLKVALVFRAGCVRVGTVAKSEIDVDRSRGGVYIAFAG